MWDIADQELGASVGEVLDDVEALLRDGVASADPLVTEAAQHLAVAGGKRFRPRLVALAGHVAGAPDRRQLVRAGAAVELIHLGTLYHDDVMDEAVVRRGAPSANSRWSNSVAILVGDYLFARGADLAVELGIDAVRIQAHTFSRLVQGQIAETAGPRGADPVAHYLEVISDKTAALIATAARFGGMFGGADPAGVDRLARFGETIGVAFQLSDDLLDIASDAVESGKLPGTDLREGVPTLPVLYARASTDADAGSARLREMLAGGAITDEAAVAEALALLRESAALKRARETVRGYAEEARAQLATLPAGPARDALAALCDEVVDRTA